MPSLMPVHTSSGMGAGPNPAACVAAQAVGIPTGALEALKAGLANGDERAIREALLATTGAGPKYGT